MQPSDLKLFRFEINMLRAQLEEIVSNRFFFLFKLLVTKYQYWHGTSEFEAMLAILILLLFYKA